MAKSVPLRRTLAQLGEPIVALHAKNAAAKRRIEKALAAGEKPSPRDFKHVPVRVCTHTFVEKPKRTPRRSRTLTLVTGAKRDRTEFAGHCVDMAMANPNGFRTPSTKAKKQHSTSLVELTSIAAGMAKRPEWERSKRGQKKREAAELTKARILEERENGVKPKYLHSHARRRRAKVAMGSDFIAFAPDVELTAE